MLKKFGNTSERRVIKNKKRDECGAQHVRQCRRIHDIARARASDGRVGRHGAKQANLPHGVHPQASTKPNQTNPDVVYHSLCKEMMLKQVFYFPWQSSFSFSSSSSSSGPSFEPDTNHSSSQTPSKIRSLSVSLSIAPPLFHGHPGHWLRGRC